jgi:hypothetical protein
MHNWRLSGILIPLIGTPNCNVYAKEDIEALAAERAGRVRQGRPPKSRAAA